MLGRYVVTLYKGYHDILSVAIYGQGWVKSFELQPQGGGCARANTIALTGKIYIFLAYSMQTWLQ